MGWGNILAGFKWVNCLQIKEQILQIYNLLPAITFHQVVLHILRHKNIARQKLETGELLMNINI